MEKISQKTVILDHLRRFGSIEPLTALREYGCLRLAARISDLRSDGYNIVTQKTVSKSKVTGKTVIFANYKLVADVVQS